MKALLVTSRVTFVPRNYDDFVVAMASCPQVHGLLVLDNAKGSLVVKALGLILVGARRVGRALLCGFFGPSSRRRERAYEREGKPVYYARSINSREVAELVHAQGIDLLVNARTRQIYRKRILRAPRLGCINVHHGLLPEQRGTMCDLWSLFERQPAGFSIHAMESKVDAGGILARVQVSDGSDRDYLAYLASSARKEVEALCSVLATIDARDAIRCRPNRMQRTLPYRRDPTRRELRALRRQGVRV